MLYQVVVGSVSTIVLSSGWQCVHYQLIVCTSTSSSVSTISSRKSHLGPSCPIYTTATTPPHICNSLAHAKPSQTNPNQSEPNQTNQTKFKFNFPIAHNSEAQVQRGYLSPESLGSVQCTMSTRWVQKNRVFLSKENITDCFHQYKQSNIFFLKRQSVITLEWWRVHWLRRARLFVRFLRHKMEKGLRAVFIGFTRENSQS